jgi:hypothetical protein
MMVLPIWVKYELDMAVQCSHDADPGEHRRAIMFNNQQKRLHRGLPFVGVVFRLRQLGYVSSGVLQRDELATARQRYRFVKRSFPAAISHLVARVALPLPIRQDNSNSRRACFFDLAGETAIFTLSPSAVRKPNSRSKE